MKFTNSLLIFLAFTIFSCKKNEKVPLNFPDDISFLEEIKNYPSIIQPPIKQLSVSKIDINWGWGKSSIKFDYFDDGRIKNISGTIPDKTFEYYDNQLITGQEVFKLGENGLATMNLSIKAKYYYKDGFLLRVENNAFKLNYNSIGNLIDYSDKMYNASYEYTDFPNNIRQEVLQSQLLIWNYRGDYLGKFSTNLIKKATFSGIFGAPEILNFKYEFDDLKRVKKMIIERQGRDSIEYNLYY